MQENNARKQIIEKIKSADNILITVSSNPSVDELASALGLTLAINKSGRRATAVASGKMPDALKFLRPEKTFENSVDSLRDFIIALSKDKADHLRYKLVGDHVKIFITPYKTTITQNDLEFEQGDFNVDLVLALGVRSKNNLDDALAAHGRILHDASVAVITVGKYGSDLSSLNWHNSNSSSLSEVTLDIINGLNDREILTKSVATALLTGLVSETDRFSNEKTSAKAMSSASKLMMAGADQQLIVSELIAAEEKPALIEEEFEEKAPEKKEVPKPKEKPAKKPADGTLVISHDEEPEEQAEETQEAPEETPQPAEEFNQKSEEDQLEESLNDLNATPQNAFEDLAPTEEYPQETIEEINEPEVQPEPAPQVEEPAPAPEITSQPEETHVAPPIEHFAPELPKEDLTDAINEAFLSEEPANTVDYQPAQQQTPQIEQPIPEPTFQPEVTAPTAVQEPILGGTLNATTEQAADDNRRALEDDKRRTILTHGAPSAETQTQPEISQPEEAKQAVMEAFGNPQINDTQFVNPEPAPADPSFSINEPLNTPSQNEGLPLPPPIPDFTNMQMPELPPIPNFNEQANIQQPTAPEPTAYGADASSNQIMTDAVYPQSNDPAQFQIPGM